MEPRLINPAFLDQSLYLLVPFVAVVVAVALGVYAHRRWGYGNYNRMEKSIILAWKQRKAGR